MSLVGLVLLPIRFGRGLADKVLRAVTPESPAPPSALVVVDGMPEGVPPAGGGRRPPPVASYRLGRGDAPGETNGETGCGRVEAA